jgi:hypothetical protein
VSDRRPRYESNQSEQQLIDKIGFLLVLSQLLMDPERRENFDKHRITEDTPNFRHKSDYTEYRRHEMQHLDSIMFNRLLNQTESAPQLFNLHHLDIFHRQTVTAKYVLVFNLPFTQSLCLTLTFFCSTEVTPAKW